MEEEIDLRVYIDVLLRWWWLIIAGAVVTGATALIVSFLLPPKYEATAGVVMLRSRVELSLGSNFQAISDEDLLASNDSGVAISDLNKRRLQSLTAMVSNGAIAQQVIEQLGDTLDEEERDPSSLLARVRGEILEDSDTVQIVVSHRDPVKAAAIANAWAQAFEAYANSIYGDVAIAPFTDIEGQLTEAKAEYDQAQAAWVEFLAEENRIPELQRQIEEEEAIIATLRAGRQTNVNVVVNQQIEVEKRLFNTSVATAVGANLRVVENQKEEMLREFEQAYQRRRELQNLLDDARVMLRQLNEGQAVSAPTSGLSLLALKGRVFAVTSGSANTLLPFGTLDLEIPSADALAMSSTVEEQSADLKAVISVIQKEIKSLDAYIQQQADAWASGEGYQFMQILTPEYLDPTNSPAGETLNRMQEWDGLLSYAGVLNAPLDQEINRLEEHVRSLKSEVTRLNGLKDELQQSRDLAWRSYNNLLSKQQELKIASASEGTEVRFASLAVPPHKPASPKVLLNTAVGLALGLMVAVFGAFLCDYIGVENDPRKWRQGLRPNPSNIGSGTGGEPHA